MTATPAPRRYAMRRLNPFLGVTQVVETDAGRAISVNGLNWEIEVRVERPASAWGSLNVDREERAYLRYGIWSEDYGLASRGYAAHFQSSGLLPRTEQVIAAVRDSLPELPFPVADSHELWLFDQEQHEPLVLLAATRPEQPKPRPEPLAWSACLSGDIPSQRRFPQGQQLNDWVKRRAGFNLDKRWIERRETGDGSELRTGAQLAAERFPALLLRADWPEPQQTLVDSYFEWIAPVLLTLAGLDPQLRARLEQTLHKQAACIEHHWRLYPQTCNPQLIQAARVQSRLQASQTE